MFGINAVVGKGFVVNLNFRTVSIGDTGEKIVRTDTTYYKKPYYPEIEFNGIDAISDDDETLQIQLETPEDVTDIDFIDVYRFSLDDYQNASEHEDYTTKVVVQ